MTTKRKRGGDTVPFTVHLPPDVRDMLENAKKATGATYSELINEAIYSELPKVVEKILADRQRAAAAFQEKYQPESSTPKANRKAG